MCWGSHRPYRTDGRWCGLPATRWLANFLRRFATQTVRSGRFAHSEEFGLILGLANPEIYGGQHQISFARVEASESI